MLFRSPLRTLEDIRHLVAVRILIGVLQFRIVSRYSSNHAPVQIDHSDSFREGCAVTSITVNSDPRDWRNALACVVQEVREELTTWDKMPVEYAVEDKNLLAGHILLLFSSHAQAQDLFLSSSRPVAALELRADLDVLALQRLEPPLQLLYSSLGGARLVELRLGLAAAAARASAVFDRPPALRSTQTSAKTFPSSSPAYTASPLVSTHTHRTADFMYAFAPHRAASAPVLRFTSVTRLSALPTMTMLEFPGWKRTAVTEASSTSSAESPRSDRLQIGKSVV